MGKMKEVMEKIIGEAAIRTRKEVSCLPLDTITV